MSDRSRESDCFREALSRFSGEVANKGAICHLADIGYTAGQIVDALDFPAPFSRVQDVMWEHFLEEGVILCEEPGSGKRRGKSVFVKEYGPYGRTSFRRAAGPAEERAVCWSDCRYLPSMGTFASFLRGRCAANGEACSYAFFDLAGYRSGQARVHDTEYLEGLPVRPGRFYHRLDDRMQRILCELYEQGAYEGALYFERSQERVQVSPQRCARVPFLKRGEDQNGAFGKRGDGGTRSGI